MTLLELPEAIRAKIMSEPNTGCWRWVGRFGGDKCSYAMIGQGRTSRKAARYIYELFFGSIDPSLVVDHLCRNRWCVNPMHLEPVTQKENVRRGIGLAARNAVKTHCLNGHPLSGENLLIYRQPLSCLVDSLIDYDWLSCCIADDVLKPHGRQME